MSDAVGQRVMLIARPGLLCAHQQMGAGLLSLHVVMFAVA
jgi:hypothetical protein